MRIVHRMLGMYVISLPCVMIESPPRDWLEIRGASLHDIARIRTLNGCCVGVINCFPSGFASSHSVRTACPVYLVVEYLGRFYFSMEYY